jgi:hypothetical protein
MKPKKKRYVPTHLRIKTKLRYKEMWKADRDRMLKVAGYGRAAAERLHQANREWIWEWLKTQPKFFLKEEITERIKSRMTPDDTRSPDSIFRLMIRHKFVEFSLEEGLWKNLSLLT